MKITQNQPYGAHPMDVFDFYQVKSNQPTPLLLFIHGGGFAGGDKVESCIEQDKQGALTNGISYAAINYPMMPEMALPEIMQHIARAVQYFRYHAKQFNINPTQIGCYGGSAGAGASLYLAVCKDFADKSSYDTILHESSRPNVIGLYATQATYDIFDWVRLFENTIPDVEDLFNQSAETISALYGFPITSYKDKSNYNDAIKQFDMLSNIHKDMAPVFIRTDVTDDNLQDFLHHPVHARAVEQKCKEQGVKMESHYAGQDERWFYRFFLDIINT